VQFWLRPKVGEVLTGYLQLSRVKKPAQLARSLASGFAATEFANLELPLPDLLRQLNSADHHAGSGEALQAHHLANPILYPSVVLFDSVIQIFARPRAYALGQFVIFLQLRHRPMRCRIGIQCDFRRHALVLHSLSQELFGCFHITPPAQIEVDSESLLVHRSIQVDPCAPYLYICLIHSPGPAAGPSRCPARLSWPLDREGACLEKILQPEIVSVNPQIRRITPF
jgi:hypothetical protein